ncbi:MAG: hypothetical protein IT379_00620 [Deltaproteobacteria bacterium]|nr:hypothetical protein [Deltaproteobacteria bacterium]
MRALASLTLGLVLASATAGCGRDTRAAETDRAGTKARKRGGSATETGPAKTSPTPETPSTPPIDLGRERLVVAGMALATPTGWSMYRCDDPCVFVLRANSVVGGILPNVKLEVFLDMPGTLDELRANGARTYSADGTIPVTQETTRLGDDPAFDLSYDVRGSPFRQVARHAKKGNVFYVLTISGPAALPNAPAWSMLRAVMNDARIVGPEPTVADLRRLQRTEQQRVEDLQRTERFQHQIEGRTRVTTSTPEERAGQAPGAPRAPDAPRPPTKRPPAAPDR